MDLVCKPCGGLTFQTKEIYDLHLSLVHEQKIAKEEEKDNVLLSQKIKGIPNRNLQQEEPNSKKKKEFSKYTKCLLCEKSFKYPYVLKTHVQTVHEGKKTF